MFFIDLVTDPLTSIFLFLKNKYNRLSLFRVRVVWITISIFPKFS